MVRIDPAKFVAAADAYDGVAQEALNYAIAARGTLSGYRGAAGTDPGGEKFAESYDNMAHAALQVLYDVGVTTRGFDRLLMASAGTHAQANANAEGIVYDASGAYQLRTEIPPTTVAKPPSVFGGRPDTQVRGLDDVGQWILDQVINAYGTFFPDGDPEKLEDLGAAWEGILADIRALRTGIRQGDNSLAGIDSGEVTLISTKVEDFANGLTEFLSTEDGIGAIDDICTDYAQTIRDTIEESFQMIAQLAIEIAVSIGVSAALSFFTFGAAGVAGAGFVAARVAWVAGRIGTLVANAVARGSALAIRLMSITTRVRAVAANFPRLTRAAIEVTSGTVASITAETVQGADANYGVAALSGFAGGTVTTAIVAPFGKHGQRFVVQALANTTGGVAGTAVDMGARGEDITAASLALGGGLGLVGSARLPGRRTPASTGSSGRSGGVETPEINVPTGTGATTGSAVDGTAPRAQFDGPAGQGGEIGGSGGDSGAAPTSHGEAPAEQEIVVTRTDADDAPGSSAESSGETPGQTPANQPVTQPEAPVQQPEAPTQHQETPGTGSSAETSTGGGNQAETPAGTGTPAVDHSGTNRPPADQNTGAEGRGDADDPAVRRPGNETEPDAEADVDAKGDDPDVDPDADPDATAKGDEPEAEGAHADPEPEAVQPDPDPEPVQPDPEPEGTQPDPDPEATGDGADDAGYVVDKVRTQVDVPPSPEFTDAVEARRDAVAARDDALAARNDIIDSLHAQGIDVDPKQLTVKKIDDTIAGLQLEVQSRTDLTPQQRQEALADLNRLSDASFAERAASNDLNAASQDMGEIAARDAIEAQGGTILHDGRGEGPGRFDTIGLSRDGQTLILMEAKGGNARLSTTGRLLPDGTRAPQGSTHYFNDVFRVDPNVRALLEANPALRQGLADGTIKVDYQLTTASPTGRVSLFDLQLDANALHLDLGPEPPSGTGSGDGSGGGGPSSDAGGTPPVNEPAHTGLPVPPTSAAAGGEGLSSVDFSQIDAEYRLPSGEVPPERLAEWSQAVSDAYPTLTPEQVRGIYDYSTNDGYTTMNPYLRDLTTPTDVPSVEARITAATDGIAALPAQPGTTYRGVGLDDARLAAFEPGTTWSDPAFGSSSSRLGVAENFRDQAGARGEIPALIEIHGLNGKDVLPISQYPGEAELLFQRGTVFDVISKMQDASGSWHIVLRETTP